MILYHVKSMIFFVIQLTIIINIKRHNYFIIIYNTRPFYCTISVIFTTATQNHFLELNYSSELLVERGKVLEERFSPSIHVLPQQTLLCNQIIFTSHFSLQLKGFWVSEQNSTNPFSLLAEVKCCQNCSLSCIIVHQGNTKLLEEILNLFEIFKINTTFSLKIQILNLFTGKY